MRECDVAPDVRLLKGAARDALHASVASANAWYTLLKTLAKPLACAAANLADALAPVVLRAAIAFAAQPRHHLLAEAALLLVALVVWRLFAFLERRRYYRRLKAAVRRKRAAALASVHRRSRLLARVLPHLLFASLCAAVTYASRRLDLEPTLLPLFAHLIPLAATGLPWLHTALLLSPSADGTHRLGALRFWVLWGVARAVAGLGAEIPFASSVTSRVPERIVTPLRLWVAVWLIAQIGAVEVLYGVVAPLVSERGRRVAAILPTLPAGLAGRLGAAAQLLLPAALLPALSQAAGEGVTLVCAGAFFLSPAAAMRRVGILLFSLAYPALRSISAHDLAAEAGRPSAVEADAVVALLRYWLLHVLVDAAFLHMPLLAWIPFSSSLRILFALWLQLPFFRTLTLTLSSLTPLRRRFAGVRAITESRTLEATSPSKPTPRATRSNALYSRKLRKASVDESDDDAAEAAAAGAARTRGGKAHAE